MNKSNIQQQNQAKLNKWKEVLPCRSRKRQSAKTLMALMALMVSCRRVLWSPSRIISMELVSTRPMSGSSDKEKGGYDTLPWCTWWTWPEWGHTRAATGLHGRTSRWTSVLSFLEIKSTLKHKCGFGKNFRSDLIGWLTKCQNSYIKCKLYINATNLLS